MSPSEDSTHDSKRELDTEPPVMLPPDLQSLSPESGDNEDGSKASLPEAGQSAKGDKYGTEDSLTNFIDRISIPGFTIEKELGRGGMGAVFLATEESLQRKVALKIVSQSLVGSTGLRERFDSEVKTLASLHHSNIAQLYTAGLTNDEPFFAMEYVDGPTLDRYVPETLKDREAAELLTSLCDAVSYCHEKGVIHRDLKPSNILLTSKGQPKIADFGLAKALNKDDTSTKTGEILGTPGYMSPEQAGGVVKNMGPAATFMVWVQSFID